MDLDRLSALSDSIIDVAKGEDLRASLKRLVTNAVALTKCKYGALGAIGKDGRLAEFTWVGLSEESADEIVSFPEGKGLLGHLLKYPEPLRLESIRSHPASSGFPSGHPTMNSFLGVPIRIRDEVYGSLYLTEKLDGSAFTIEDEQLVIMLASAAGIAIDNYRGQMAQLEVGVLADRERIARDLHDLVIQRLFATGLTLQPLAKDGVLQEELQAKVKESLDNLDATVQQIRHAIFALQEQRPLQNIRTRILREVEATKSSSGLEIECHFQGSIETAIFPALSDHVIAVVRELFSNVVRHAQASRIELTITATKNSCEVQVFDDGVGFMGSERKSGLRNLRQRASENNGSFDILKTGSTGTLAIWRVSL